LPLVREIQGMDPNLSPDADWSELYVDGEWREAEDGETIAVEDPSTRETFARVARGTESDVNAAYEAAAAAQEEWAEAPPAQREEVIHAMLELLEEHD
jgi:aldehyde dehydrogenase (NAD+)